MPPMKIVTADALRLSEWSMCEVSASFRTDAPIQLCKATAISRPIATTMNETETNLPASM